jgi:hypothetical protein
MSSSWLTVLINCNEDACSNVSEYLRCISCGVEQSPWGRWRGLVREIGWSRRGVSRSRRRRRGSGSGISRSRRFRLVCVVLSCAVREAGPAFHAELAAAGFGTTLWAEHRVEALEGMTSREGVCVAQAGREMSKAFLVYNGYLRCTRSSVNMIVAEEVGTECQAIFVRQLRSAWVIACGDTLRMPIVISAK